MAGLSEIEETLATELISGQPQVRKRAQLGIYTAGSCSIYFANTPHQEQQVDFQLDERAAGDEMKTSF